MPAHLAATKQDIDAISDNYKEAAEIIWPGKDPLNGQKLLSNGLNAKQAQKLDLKELKAIVDAACIHDGKSHVVEYLLKDLPCEFRWVPRSVMIERAKAEISSIADQLNAAVSRANKWLGAAK